MDTPEIRKGYFVFRDTLFVDLGTTKRHSRASPAELKDLLLPKSASSAPKDQVAHWYEAQLIHYGLPRSKDKNTAKVRLTSAGAAKTLAVPKDVVALEAEMKKEYVSALRKGKSAASGGKGATEKKTTTASTAKSSTSKTTIELEIDGIKVKIDREAIDAAKKKTTKAKGTTPTPKGAKANVSKPKSVPATKATAAKSTAKKSTPASKAANVSKSSPAKASTNTPAPPPPMKKQTARKSISMGSETYVVTDSVPSPPPMKKQTARRSKPFSYGANSRPSSGPGVVYDHTPSSFHHETDMDDAPPSYESIAFSQPSPTASRSNGVQISGTYFFPGPPMQPFDLILQIDQAAQKLWGRFQIGSKDGVLRMDNISNITSGDAIAFGWRSEDQNDGFMKFGRSCDGTMAFDGEGWMRGHFKGLMYGEDVNFEGNLVNGEGLDVAEAAAIWDDFPRKAYGKSQNRSGQWQP